VASWQEFSAAEPEFAVRVKTLLTRGKHATMATLRADGGPRISGTELEISDGEVWIGAMPGALRTKDLRRDPRMALHGPQQDPPEGSPEQWPGEAKLSGRAVEVPRPGQQADFFRIDLTEVVVTRLAEPADHLVIESWHEGRGVSRLRR